MRTRYIEVTAGAPQALGLYHQPGEAAEALAKHHAAEGRDGIATAIKRAAAELAEVLPEAVIATDLWRATVWQADHYNATHTMTEREDGYRRRSQPDPDPVEVEQEIGETQRRVLDVLAGAWDAIVDDVVHLGQYKGPDAAHHAKNQADRELHDAIVHLVRQTRRTLR